MKGEKDDRAPNPLEAAFNCSDTGDPLQSGEGRARVPPAERRSPGEAGEGAGPGTGAKKAGASDSVCGAPDGSETGGAFSFEKGLKRLEEIVESLEKEDIALEESLKLWEEGAALVRKLEAILDRAHARIEQVLQDEDGRVYTIPVEREPG